MSAPARARLVAIATSAIVTVVLGFSPHSIEAQQTPPAQAPVFRAGVDLVALDVTVVDRNGAPVKGLDASAFTVRINNQVRPVRTLDYIEYGAGAATVSTGAQSSNTATGATRASQGGRVIVILFDDLSIKPGEAEGLTIAAERMLTTLDLDDLVGLTTTSGLGPVVSPTRDRAAIIAALGSKRLVGRLDDDASPFLVTVKEAVEIEESRRDVLRWVLMRECPPLIADPSCADRVAAAARRLGQLTFRRAEMQISAIRETIDALRQAPKPRVIVTLSSGLAVGFGRSYREDLEPISQAAAQAEVQFYALAEVGDRTTIQTVGTTPPSVPTEYHPANAVRAENDYLVSGIQTVATAAGGEAFKVIGQGERFFERIYSETSGVYRLGVESGPLKAGDRFLDVKVAIDRPGVTVRAHRHALVPGVTAAADSIDEQLRNRLAQGGIAFGVPIAVATAVRGGTGSGVRVAVDAQMPATSAGPLMVGYGFVDAKGAMVSSGRREVPVPAAGDYRVTFDGPVAPGAYRLRFVVADANGNIGAVQHDVNATLTRFGGVQVSDVMLTSVGADGVSRFLALDALPAGAVSLRAAVELYPDQPADAAGLTVRLALLQADTSAIVATRDIVPTAADSTLAAGATLPVAALAPAPYVVQVTILNRGVPVGTLIAPFRKSIPSR